MSTTPKARSFLGRQKGVGLPPGTIWPPPPQGRTGKIVVLPGYGYHYAVVDAGPKPSGTPQPTPSVKEAISACWRPQPL
jgi:hypothetical protein